MHARWLCAPVKCHGYNACMPLGWHCWLLLGLSLKWQPKKKLTQIIFTTTWFKSHALLIMVTTFARKLLQLHFKVVVCIGWKFPQWLICRMWFWDDLGKPPVQWLLCRMWFLRWSGHVASLPYMELVCKQNKHLIATVSTCAGLWPWQQESVLWGCD